MFFLLFEIVAKNFWFHSRSKGSLVTKSVSLPELPTTEDSSADARVLFAKKIHRFLDHDQVRLPYLSDRHYLVQFEHPYAPVYSPPQVMQVLEGTLRVTPLVGRTPTHR